MSFKVKLNKTNFSCAPLLVEGFSGNETIGYMCKANKIREGFHNDVPEYNDNTIYKVGDMVKKDGVVYKMIDGIGDKGYPPPRPTNWQPQAQGVPEYDNGKVYQLGNNVKKDGVVYTMIDGIGQAGYPPPRPTNWGVVPEYNNGTIYQLNNLVHKDGVVYKMIDGIGQAGYPPPRPTNWAPQKNN
jgi:hypothetical protein